MGPGDHLKDIVGSKGKELLGRKIVLCVTGSVAAVESPTIARELMRRGAEVIPVMSRSACAIIAPDLMEWATGNRPITEITGRLEHIELAGQWKGRTDLILVAPCTSNTISKIACGIDDTTVTTVVSTAIGTGVPVVIAPAMHISLYDHPIVREHVAKLRALGVVIVEPKVEEGKAKIATPGDTVMAVVRRLAPKDMSGLRILVTGGTTREFIDPIRFVANKSSGKMAMALAEEASARGAGVTLLAGPMTIEPTPALETIRVETAKDMYEAALKELKSKEYHAFLAVAAVADFSPEKACEQKIQSDEVRELSVRLSLTPKIVDEVKRISPKTFLIVFKAEYNLTDEELVKRGYERLKRASADLVVVNDIARKGCAFGSDTNEVFVIDADKKVIHIPLTSKRDVARQLLDMILARMKR